MSIDVAHDREIVKIKILTWWFQRAQYLMINLVSPRSISAACRNFFHTFSERIEEKSWKIYRKRILTWLHENR